MIRKVKAFGRNTILTINLVAVAALLLSYLSTKISPAQFAPLAFFGIGYGFLLVTNLFFVVFWLFFKKRLALISAITIVLGYNSLSSYFQLNFWKSPEIEGNSFRIVSQNVKLFGWYNWSENIANRDDIMRNLETINGDVFCFQEYFHHSRPGIFETRERLRLVLNAPHVYDAYTTTVAGDQHYGIAIYSKFPIVNRGEMRFQGERNNNMCIFTDLIWNGDTVRIYNAHAASIRFSESEYAVAEEIATEKDEAKVDLRDLRNIAGRMLNAYERRATQVEAIRKHMDNCPYPSIVCGDFNDTPISYSYSTISEGYRDAFRESGSGIGSTYRGAFPSFRIDYIFHSANLISRGYQTHSEEISDHRAISCLIGRPE